MPTLELEETPPLVYQLLLLSMKGYKGEILRGIVEHYQSLDQQGQEESVRERYAISSAHFTSSDTELLVVKNLATITFVA